MSDMTAIQRVILWGMVALIAVWVVRHLAIFWIERQLHVLTKRSPRVERGRAPRVTAIIPAKDEEATLDECLRSVRAQEYPDLEILVVDDRSADGTAAIARAHAAEDPRVRLVSIRSLPEGWTGKTHALHVATAEATGEWLWFLDADTRHEPGCLSIVMRYAQDQGASMASLIPKLRCGSFWESILQPLAGIVLMRSFPLILVNKNSSPAAFANGQFILIERSAYEAAGGHESVRDKFVEDIYLARRVKAAGAPIRVAMAGEISSTRMYTSLDQIIRGWSRILYDALGRRPLPLSYKIIEPLVFTQTGQVAFLASLAMLATGTPDGPFPAWLFGLGTLYMVVSHTVMIRMYRISSAPGRLALWYALAGFVMDWVYFRALFMCLSGRVTWRGTTYSWAGPRPPEPQGEPQAPPLPVGVAARDICESSRI